MDYTLKRGQAEKEAGKVLAQFGANLKGNENNEVVISQRALLKLIALGWLEGFYAGNMKAMAFMHEVLGNAESGEEESDGSGQT